MLPPSADFSCIAEASAPGGGFLLLYFLAIYYMAGATDRVIGGLRLLRRRISVMMSRLCQSCLEIQTRLRKESANKSENCINKWMPCVGISREWNTDRCDGGSYWRSKARQLSYCTRTEKSRIKGRKSGQDSQENFLALRSEKRKLDV